MVQTVPNQAQVAERAVQNVQGEADDTTEVHVVEHSARPRTRPVCFGNSTDHRGHRPEGFTQE